MKPRRLYRTPHHIPRLILDRATVWTRSLGDLPRDGFASTVLRDGRGHRYTAHYCGEGVLQVQDTLCQTLASRFIWARAHSATIGYDGSIYRTDSVQWSPWRTYDHPSGTRRTLPR
jgi:hypothetical protein